MPLDYRTSACATYPTLPTSNVGSKETQLLVKGGVLLVTLVSWWLEVLFPLPNSSLAQNVV